MENNTQEFKLCSMSKNIQEGEDKKTPYQFFSL